MSESREGEENNKYVVLEANRDNWSLHSTLCVVYRIRLHRIYFRLIVFSLPFDGKLCNKFRFYTTHNFPRIGTKKILVSFFILSFFSSIHQKTQLLRLFWCRSELVKYNNFLITDNQVILAQFIGFLYSIMNHFTLKQWSLLDREINF